MEERWGSLNDEADDYWQSDEDYYENDEQETTAEIKAFERTGGIGIGGMMSSGLGVKRDKANQDKTEHFAERMDAVSRNLDSFPGITINENDLVDMMKRAKQTKNIEHINPTAFVLGYMATNGGRNMEVEKVREIIEKVLPKTNLDSVRPADIVRYSRFWVKKS